MCGWTEFPGERKQLDESRKLGGAVRVQGGLACPRGRQQPGCQVGTDEAGPGSRGPKELYLVIGSSSKLFPRRCG